MHKALMGVALTLAAVGCAEAGRDGVDGMDGIDGMDGADGAYASETLHCEALANGFFYEYDVVLWSSGDLFVNCSVSNENVEASDTVFYLASQNGAVSGECALAMDENGTGGYWVFELAGTTAQTEYYDEGDINDGYTLTFLGSECIYAEAP
jgi:hypothetical protein